MIQKNIVFAIRNIIKNKVNSIITIVGLSVAFACLLLIYLYVSQEFNYNSFHVNKDNIFRISYIYKLADGTEGSNVLLEPILSETIKKEVPYVIRSTAFRGAGEPTLIFETINFEERLCITESDFFNMFSFKLILGNKNELFKNPDEIVITSSLAEKFQAVDSCTKEELLGKNILFMNTGSQPFIITGIMEDIPENSSIQFDALIPFEHEKRFSQSNNSLGNSTIFYEINEKKNSHLAEEQVIISTEEYYKSLREQLLNQKILADTPDNFKVSVSSVDDTYLDKTISDYERNNSKTSLYILSAIGMLILIIACSNFIMLSLGQSLNRTGETGIRKAMGAKKMDIFNLFFVESIILTAISLAFGILIFTYILPIFNQLAQNEIYLNLINIPDISLFAISCTLIIVALTSIIPVVKLVKINPNVMASKALYPGNNNYATRMFVTVQYAISVTLIILTIFIIYQTKNMKTEYPGFSSENIINLRINHISNTDKFLLRDKLKDYPGTVNLTMTDRNYINGSSDKGIMNPQGENIRTRLLKVDHNYIPTLNLKIIKGENFKENNFSDGDLSIIVNEKFLSLYGLKDNVIGQIIRLNDENFKIIGVINDFHYDSMKEEIKPLILFSRRNMGNNYNCILIKFIPVQLEGLISHLKDTWNELFPDKEFDFKFWDEQLNNRYEAEDRWIKVIGYTSIIAIIISSLGLFGLTLIIINKRVKEIGIRKINGAKITDVMILLNRTFLNCVLIAFIIACPISWYILNKWLQNFAYKTELSWWIFAMSGLGTLGIALLTVSWQSWRAATRNPVEALRYE